MTDSSRVSIDLKSQDLKVDDMVKFKGSALSGAEGKNEKFQELIMFSSKSKPYQYSSLEDFKKDTVSIPNDTSYFYYTITFPSGNRYSLYLDPDRPAKMVLDGSNDFIKTNRERMEKAFPPGGDRYKAQGNMGIFLIWGIVVSIATAVMVGYSLIFSPNGFLILWVIFISSMLGIYLSIYNKTLLNPANTMALGNKRKNPYLNLILHMITITLGIISVVLVIVFLEFNL